MVVKWRLVGEFYATVGVPVLYGVILGVIWRWPEQVGLVLWLRALGLIVAVAGMGLWLVSYVHLGKGFGVLPRRSKRVKRGVYRWMRHPMYVGISLTLGGLALARASLAGTGLVLGVLIPVLMVRARLEDAKLED